MSSPHLDHAELEDRRWCWVAGCWREWSAVHAEWRPSEAPPADARLFNYREHILGRCKGGVA